MISQPRNLIQKITRKYHSIDFLSIMLVAGCFWMAGCGQPSSNNLPVPDDSVGANKDAGGSDTTGQLGRSATPALAAADTGKLGGIWFLVAVLPSDTAAGKIPAINFDESSKKFSGNTGCNNMRGSFSVTDSTLKIDEQIITTKMACPGYNEDAFLKNLPKANGYRFENGMLILLSDQTELSRWTREPVKPTTKTT